MLEQVVLRLSKARFSSCIQNLITCILKLIGKFGSAIIDLLKVDCGVVKLRINDAVHESRHSLLSIFLHIWNDQVEYMDGYYISKLNALSMFKMILLRDPGVENVVVEGDEIVDVTEGRRTRSSKKHFMYQQIPWPLRAFQTLARLLDDPRRNIGSGTDVDDLMMMQEFAQEGALFEDGLMGSLGEDDDDFAKYDLSDVIGKDGKSIFDFDSAGGLARSEQIELEKMEMNDECRHDVSAINDEYYQANLQEELRSFFWALWKENKQMYEHCLKHLDNDTVENVNAAVDAHNLQKHANEGNVSQ